MTTGMPPVPQGSHAGDLSDSEGLGWPTERDTAQNYRSRFFCSLSSFKINSVKECCETGARGGGNDRGTESSNSFPVKILNLIFKLELHFIIVKKKKKSGGKKKKQNQMNSLRENVKILVSLKPQFETWGTIWPKWPVNIMPFCSYKGHCHLLLQGRNWYLIYGGTHPSTITSFTMIGSRLWHYWSVL